MSKLSTVSSALSSCVPTLSARFKKNQAHIYDVLGPFPDEPLSFALDRVLYYSGAQKLQKLFNWPTAVDGCTKARGCEVIVETAKTPKTCCCKQENCTCDCPSKASKPSCVFKCKKRPAISKGSSRSRQRPVRVDFANSVVCDKDESKSKADIAANIEAALGGSTGTGCAAIGAKLKRSFSLCSLACRRIKNKCASRSRCCASGDNGEGKWLWTRLVTQADGSKVYELYENSSVKTDPNSIDCAKGPKVIFVMLPNGSIMQFEGLACH